MVVDALAAFLEGPRARRAFLLRSLLEPPWSLRIEDRAPLTVIVLLRGRAWLVPDAEPPCELRPGDVAIVCGPDPYTVADDPATAPQVVILPGERCVTPEGESLSEVMDLGVRTWGNSPTGSVMMLTGTYQTDGEVSRRLLDALPQQLVLRGDSWSSPVIPLLVDEVAKNDPGQEVVLDRLLDVLLVASLKAWFSQPGADPPRWFQAHDDPVVGEALRLLQHQPAHPWTVASLAAACGVSRAAFARRFHELVGEPPMTYLTGWRLALAADLLLEPSATVSSVSRQVGYGSAFTFSTAFKRVYGVSPREHRDRARAESVA
jgi:AraC-like DNA-binding protein